MSGVRVPLAVDAQVRVPFGPVLVPLRALILLTASAPLALWCLSLGTLSVGSRLGLAIAVMMLGFTLAAPVRDRNLDRDVVPLSSWWSSVLDGGTRWRGSPGASEVCGERHAPVADSERDPVAAAPAPAPSSERSANREQRGRRDPATESRGCARHPYAGRSRWIAHERGTRSVVQDSHAVVAGVGVPGAADQRREQLRQPTCTARIRRRTKSWPATRLAELERDLAGRVAEQSIGLRHFVVLAPGLASADGIPWLSRVTRLPRALEASDDDAARALLTALRTSPTLGLAASVADRDDIAELLVDTVVGATSAAISGAGVVRIGDEFQIVLTATRLPPTVHPGAVVDALIRSRAKGYASLHLLPVETKVARRVLDRRAAMQRYTAREGNDAIDNQIALADTSAALAAIAQRQLIPCRIALSFAVRTQTRRGRRRQPNNSMASSEARDLTWFTRLLQDCFRPWQLRQVSPRSGEASNSLQMPSPRACCLLWALRSPTSGTRWWALTSSPVHRRICLSGADRITTW